jgi:hypothetical protein
MPTSMHLLFNAFTFWPSRSGSSARIGSERFFWLYVPACGRSDLRHLESGTATSPSTAPSGASGAITAVLFASIVYFPTGSIFILPIPVPNPVAAVRPRPTIALHLGGVAPGRRVASTTMAPLGRASPGIAFGRARPTRGRDRPRAPGSMLIGLGTAAPAGKLPAFSAAGASRSRASVQPPACTARHAIEDDGHADPERRGPPAASAGARRQ